jgi:hypothetical protein
MEFDAQGNLNKMTNRDKNIAITFSAQGFFYYISNS